MRYAVFSDVHSNADAFEAVLAKCRALKVDHYVSLGDIVGYNAEPKKCIRMCRELNLFARVRGNHDQYVADCSDGEIAGFNPHARHAVLWTREQLDEEERRFVTGESPLRMTVPAMTATIVHATLDSPESWGYIFDRHAAKDNFAYQFTPICFCGHSHVPVAFCKKPSIASGSDPVTELEEWVASPGGGEEEADFSGEEVMTVELLAGHKYLFNVGSVGQPRNRDPRCSFAVLDTDRREVSRYILPYDIEAAQEKVRLAGLPERLSSRLAYGQ